MLRTKLIAHLGEFEDNEIIAGARERFQKFLSDPKSLPPDLRPAIFGVVGRHADQKAWDAMHQLGLNTKSIEEKENFYFAMASALGPDLARQTLQLSLTDELPPSSAIGLVSQVASAGEQPELAWAFTQEHREELDAKLDALGRINFVPAVMRAFLDPARAQALEAYARKNLPSGAKSQVAKAAEMIRLKADLKMRLIPKIRRWLATKTAAVRS